MSLDEQKINNEFKKLREDVDTATKIRELSTDWNEREKALANELEAKRKLRRAMMKKRVEELQDQDVRLSLMENEYAEPNR